MTARIASPFVFIGNHRALDFVNTQVAVEGVPTDLLPGLPALASWLVQAGAVDRPAARTAVAKWDGTRAGEALMAEARTLRGALRRLADAVAAGRRVPRAALDHVNRLLARGAGVARVVSDEGGFVTRRGLRLDGPADLLVPIAEAAADLLCHADLTRIRRCAHPACKCLVQKDGPFGKYCSEHCKESADISELRCECRHPACR